MRRRRALRLDGGAAGGRAARPRTRSRRRRATRRSARRTRPGPRRARAGRSSAPTGRRALGAACRRGRVQPRSAASVVAVGGPLDVGGAARVVAPRQVVVVGRRSRGRSRSGGSRGKPETKAAGAVAGRLEVLGHGAHARRAGRSRRCRARRGRAGCGPVRIEACEGAVSGHVGDGGREAHAARGQAVEGRGRRAARSRSSRRGRRAGCRSSRAGRSGARRGRGRPAGAGCRSHEAAAASEDSTAAGDAGSRRGRRGRHRASDSATQRAHGRLKRSAEKEKVDTTKRKGLESLLELSFAFDC